MNTPEQVIRQFYARAVPDVLMSLDYIGVLMEVSIRLFTIAKEDIERLNYQTSIQDCDSQAVKLIGDLVGYSWISELQPDQQRLSIQNIMGALQNLGTKDAIIMYTRVFAETRLELFSGKTYSPSRVRVYGADFDGTNDFSSGITWQVGDISVETIKDAQLMATFIGQIRPAGRRLVLIGIATDNPGETFGTLDQDVADFLQDSVFGRQQQYISDIEGNILSSFWSIVINRMYENNGLFADAEVITTSKEK